MIELATSFTRPLSPALLKREIALVNLDFTRQTYRQGAHRTKVFTDLPGVSFRRTGTAEANDSVGNKLTFPPHVPRITDLGLYIGPGESCWIDLEEPLDQINIVIFFDCTNFNKDSGYRRALQVISTTRPETTAALYNDNTQDGMLRYRVDLDGTYILGPASMPIQSPIARASLHMAPDHCEVRTIHSVAKGSGVQNLQANQIILGSEGTFSGVGLPSLMTWIREIRVTQ